MNIHQAIEYIESSDEFKEFFEGNSGFELTHGFISAEKDTLSPWEIGYYSKEREKVIVFVAAETILRRPEEEAFKEDDHVPVLDHTLVECNLDQARQIAKDVHRKQYSGEPLTKELIIIQTLHGIPMWNITFITLAFNMINVKINAVSGLVISSHRESILNLGIRT